MKQTATMEQFASTLLNMNFVELDAEVTVDNEYTREQCTFNGYYKDIATVIITVASADGVAGYTYITVMHNTNNPTIEHDVQQLLQNADITKADDTEQWVDCEYCTTFEL